MKGILPFLASVAHPMMCEEKPDYAYTCNVLGTSKIIEEIINRFGKVLFFSTDMVYGEGGPFTEKSPTKPSGVYADSKVRLEEKYKHEPNFFSLRMSYFLGKDIFSRYVVDTAESNQNNRGLPGIFRNAIKNTRVLSTVLGYISGDIDANIINLAGDRCSQREEIVNIILSEKFVWRCRKVIEAPEGYFSIRPRRIEIDNSLLKSYER